MDQQLGKDQMAEILTVRVRPVFFIQQGVQKAQYHLIGFFFRHDQMLILQVLPDCAKGFGQENGQGRDELRIQPKDDPLDIPGFSFQLRPVGLSGPDQDQIARFQQIPVVFHMVKVTVGKQAVQLIKIVTMGRDTEGGGIAVVIDFDVVSAHFLHNIESRDISAVHMFTSFNNVYRMIIHTLMFFAISLNIQTMYDPEQI